MMTEYARKIANPARFTMRGERVDGSYGTSSGVIPQFAEGGPLLNSTENELGMLDFVAGKRDCPEDLLRISTGSECDDTGTVRRLPGLPVTPLGRRMAGSNPERNAGNTAGAASNVTGLASRRDPVAVYYNEILCRLLEPICPAAWGGRPVLWPLWADEMVHRTYVTIHLTALLVSKLRLDRDARMRFELDYRVASNLAAAIGGLVIVHDNERLPCSAVLRGIASDFVELFGPVAGNIRIATRIEPLLLAAFRRRALVLVVVELISQALVNAYRGLDAGHIEVQLVRISRARARLTVKNNVSNKYDYTSELCQPIGDDLASLLEADIVYGIPGVDGSVAQIDFLI